MTKTLLALLAALTILLAGCAAPPEAAAPPPAPAAPAPPKKAEAASTTFTVASINLAGLNRRIEHADIEALCRAVTREKADVLAVQSMARYPGVLTRIDPFPEIAEGTGMRSVFGEMANVSGRQTGNALYSMLPIHSHDVKPYPISSMGFESALVGLIDAGAREVAVVSTTIPAGAKSSDVAACGAFLGRLRDSYAPTPMIACGNLADPPVIDAKAFQSERAGAARTWFSAEGLRSLGARTVQTELGTLTITQFRVIAARP